MSNQRTSRIPTKESIQAKSNSITHVNAFSRDDNKPILFQKTQTPRHQCQFCDKRFTKSGNLHRHERIHKGIKPFECLTCHKKFGQKEHLNQHRRVHTKEKPFECDVCHKKFSHKNNLKKHGLIHTREKPFKCDVHGCGKRFRLKHHWQTHGAKIHGCGEGEQITSLTSDRRGKSPVCEEIPSRGSRSGICNKKVYPSRRKKKEDEDYCDDGSHLSEIERDTSPPSQQCSASRGRLVKKRKRQRTELKCQGDDDNKEEVERNGKRSEELEVNLDFPSAKRRRTVGGHSGNGDQPDMSDSEVVGDLDNFGGEQETKAEETNELLSLLSSILSHTEAEMTGADVVLPDNRPISICFKNNFFIGKYAGAEWTNGRSGDNIGNRYNERNQIKQKFN